MKHKNLVIFITITFLRSVFIATLKFFLRSYLKDVHISLEEIAGYLSLGGMIAYIVGGSLAYMFRKKNIIIFSGLIAILCLAIGNMLGYYPFRVFVLLVSSIGFAYSLRLIVKSIILSIEIQKSYRGEAKINGIINIAILTGILLGSYLGFTIFAKRGPTGFQAIIGLLVVASLLTVLMNYDRHFETKPFRQTLKQTIPNIIGIIKKYVRLLLPIGALRAISTAIGQKMLEMGVDIFQRTPKSSIVIIVISFIGAIAGQIISMLFTRKRKLIAMIFTIIFGLATIYFPHIINKFDYYITLNIFGFCTGIFFGIAVNLLEGRYFFHIGDDHRKEYGSAAYGIATSIIIFFIMITSDLLSRTVGIKICFFFFGIVLLLMPFFIKKFDAPDYPRIIKQ
ncbi:MAG: MFS transporter [Candidatus Absconditabacterales bacterium]